MLRSLIQVITQAPGYILIFIHIAQSDFLSSKCYALVSCSISNLVWDSFKYLRFFFCTVASTKNNAPQIRAAIVPAMANAKAHPKKLLSWPGIQPSSLAHMANTATAIVPHTPGGEKRHLISLDKLIDWSTLNIHVRRQSRGLISKKKNKVRRFLGT